MVLRCGRRNEGTKGWRREAASNTKKRGKHEEREHRPRRRSHEERQANEQARLERVGDGTDLAAIESVGHDPRHQDERNPGEKFGQPEKAQISLATTNFEDLNT